MHRDGQTTFEYRGLDPQPPVSLWTLRPHPERGPEQRGSLPCKAGGEREHDAGVRRWLLWAARGLKLVRPHHRPWQVAVAIAAGLSAGLLPPASLQFMLALLAICLLPVHRIASIVVALGMAVSLPDLTAILDRVGWWSLTHPATESLWLRLERLPWAPWLSLNHTVVHGGLILACVAFLPSLAVALLLARRLDAWASRATTRSVPSRLSRSTSHSLDDLTVDEPPIASCKSSDAGSLTALHAGVEESLADEEGILEERRFTSLGLPCQEFPVDPPPVPPVIKPARSTENEATSETLPSLESEASIERLEALLACREDEHERAADTREVLERAAEMTSLIDEILAQYEPSPTMNEHLDQEEATREIIRHDPQAPLTPPPLPTPPLNSLQADDPSSGFLYGSEGSAVSPAADVSLTCSDDASEDESLPLAGNATAHDAHPPANQCGLGLAAIEEAAEASTRATPLATTPAPRNPLELHDEALHHLLTHLRELKEKA